MTRLQNMVRANVTSKIAAPVCGAVLLLGCSSGAPPDATHGAASDSTHQESNDTPSDSTIDDPNHSEQGKRVVGYLPTYRFGSAQLHLDTLTHLILAFAVPNAEGGVDFKDVQPTQIEGIVTAAHDAHVKVLVALAGGAGGDVTKARLKQGVHTYVTSVRDLVDKYKLDGVDVDIEGAAIEPETYEPLMLELAQTLRGCSPPKLLTAAVAAERRENYRALGAVDFLNVMSYDHCADTDHECDHATPAQAQTDLDYWSSLRQPNEAGVPRTIGTANVVLGVPFYGRCWGEACPEREQYRDGSYAATSALTYWAIAGYCDSRKFAGCSRSADVITDGTGAHGYYVSLNSPDTIESKTKQAKAHGGMMIWELGQDSNDGALFAEITAAFPKSTDAADDEELGARCHSD
jgi:GH18 family chitinase